VRRGRRRRFGAAALVLLLAAAGAGEREAAMASKAEAAETRARALMASGGPSALVRREGRVGAAIPVEAPEGGMRFWLVPVTAGEALAGWFRLTPELTPMGWSGFQRREDSLAGCPAAADWLDRETIRARAETRARPGESAGGPVLSYDGVPDRIAWAVTLTGPDGARRVMVAGRAVWEGRAAGPPSGLGGG
jgi:hypothetical protein